MIPRGGADITSLRDGPRFFGSFEEEIRKMREDISEEIELETRESITHLQQERVNVERSSVVVDEKKKQQIETETPAEDLSAAAVVEKKELTETTPVEDAATTVAQQKKQQQQQQRARRPKNKFVQKDRNIVLTPKTAPTLISAVSVSGGGPATTKKKTSRTEKQQEEILKAHRILQYELENVQKAISRNELYRASVTCILLLILCVLMTLALRVVETSLGVPWNIYSIYCINSLMHQGGSMSMNYYIITTYYTAIYVWYNITSVNIQDSH